MFPRNPSTGTGNISEGKIQLLVAAEVLSRQAFLAAEIQTELLYRLRAAGQYLLGG